MRTTRRSVSEVVHAVQRALTPDLLKEPWRTQVLRGADPLTGHCYVAAESVFYLLGGKKAGWKPVFIRWERQPHWFLLGPGGHIVDPTWSQFSTKVDYARGTPKGFLTSRPSKRAAVVIARVLSARRVVR